ncbi:MAG TPA: tRNA (guanosine(37)-N1)-methyltransferase TrmD [Candidatus Saccharimonadales bacterium]|nr:tRNA (guanosine(37)-N1)-methyltransferase TrmD [Candidatus Saccharimonadales bacterium]
MKISILTLFPEMFLGPFEHSIVKIASEKGLVHINFVNIRDFGVGKHKMVDDTEYGGGVGMVIKVDVLNAAIAASKIKDQRSKIKEKVVLLSATGKTYNQQKADDFSKLDHLILICGHYEGVDERIKKYIDEEVSVGDFILTGGEIPAMLITDSVSRLIANVLPKGATEEESFSEIDNNILLEYPHYTKPQNYEEDHVPEILLSGNHPKIKEWRMEKALENTEKLRPDLLKKRHSG